MMNSICIYCQYLTYYGYCDCRECENYGEDVTYDGVSECECFDAG